MTAAFWTEAEDSQLRDLWGQGQSCAVIGAALGRSRNSIVGRVARLSLPAHVVKKTARTKVERPARKRPRKEKPAKAGKRAEKPAQIKLGPDPATRAVADDIMALGAAWRSLPGTAPKSFMDRRIGHECAWMIGEPSDGLCCGAKTVSGQSYCATHQAIAYRPVEGWERTATKPPFEARVRRELA